MESLGMSIRSVVVAAGAHYCESGAVKACESPIERDFAAALQTIPSVVVMLNSTVNELIKAARSSDNLGYVLVAPQVKVGRYRADFLLAAAADFGRAKVVCVECDGHAFHQATQQQFEHDRKRDRFFNDLGFEVLRFTGRRIWHEHYRCAREAVAKVTGEVCA